MTYKTNRPPGILEWLLEIFIFRVTDFGAIGDYEERFAYMVTKKGRIKANMWYLWQVTAMFPGFLIHSFIWSLSMFKSYFKIALRSLRKQKMYSVVNLVGLSIGMAVFTFFAMSAGVKFNSDRFHKNAENIFSVVQVLPEENADDLHTAFLPSLLSPALVSEFPEIDNAVRVYPAGKLTLGTVRDSFFENGVYFVDKDFLDMFTFEMILGNPQTALSEPNSLVLTEKIAKKYFGEEDPVGKELLLENRIAVKVTGVLKNLRRDSGMRYDMLINMNTAELLNLDLNDWKENKFATFLHIADANDKPLIDEKLQEFLVKHYAAAPDSPKELYLFPLLKFRLGGDHIRSIMRSTLPAAPYIVISFSFLFLSVVCINFINLTVARHMYRTKEIGVRKVVGATRFQLVKQFLGESVLLSFLAVPFAIGIYEAFQPLITSFYQGFGLVSGVSDSVFNHPYLVKYLLVAAVVTGFVSGIYPALIISSFKPASILSNNMFSKTKKGWGRKAMIVFQFSLSLILIVAASIFKDQSNHLLGADLGYNRNNIAFVKVSKENLHKLEVIKTEFSRLSGVRNITTSSDVPGIWAAGINVLPEGLKKENPVQVQAYGIGYGFVEMMEMNITKGRDFSKDKGDDRNFLVNEKAAEMFVWNDPVGRQLTMGEKTGTVVGVLEDFLFGDIGFDMPPAVLYIEKENINFVMAKYDESTSFSTLRDAMKEKWAQILPGTPFETSTLSAHFDSFYTVLKMLADIIIYSGIAIILLSSLGLLGLTSYIVERKTKEIGIRKVLGASSLKITWNVAREFLMLIFLANILVLPLTYYGWQRILQLNLLYITDIGYSQYVFALGVSLAAALFAVVSRTYKASKTNPVNSLRYE